jgi:hypothetical protein
MSSTIDDLRGALLDAAVVCAQSASGAVGAAMVKAGLQKNPATNQYDKPDLPTAGSLAAQAAQSAAAARDLAQAVTSLPPTTTTP